MIVGLATIGQAPRSDVLPSMFPGHAGMNVVQAGALDGLSDFEVNQLTPRPGEHPLVTRMLDGREVVVSKERIGKRLADAVDRLVDCGATMVCVLCTGEFSGIVADVPIVYPDKLLGSIVDNILVSGTMGVVIPHIGQTESMVRKWERPGRRVEIFVHSPYEQEADIQHLSDRISRAGLDVVALDCMGYTLRLQAMIAEAIGRPVILANRTVGAVLESMLPASQDF